MSDFDVVQERLKKFNLDRDWLQYNKPKEILVALMSEVGELADLYRWLSHEQLADLHSRPDFKLKVEEEIADIFIYLLNLCRMVSIDPVKIIDAKIDKNAEKYPVEKVKGVHSNKFVSSKN